MTNIHNTRNAYQDIAQARAERKAKAEAELAELTELAEKVLQYEATFTMVNKQQTPAQRRAHEPITQSKRWSATCKIAGMTEAEFGEKFDVFMVIHGGIFDLSGSQYTKKQALANHIEACTEEFVRFMTCLRWQQPDTFAEIVTALGSVA